MAQLGECCSNATFLLILLHSPSNEEGQTAGRPADNAPLADGDDRGGQRHKVTTGRVTSRLVLTKAHSIP